jgi:hypothetical protein
MFVDHYETLLIQSGALVYLQSAYVSTIQSTLLWLNIWNNSKSVEIWKKLQ